MKKLIITGITGSSFLYSALAFAGHGAKVPEISAGFAPLAIAVALGVVVAFREYTRRK